jgi:hypothetical protein
VSWEVSPEPPDPEELAALLAAVEQAFEDERVSAWWRSGFEELGGGPAAKEAWRGAGVVEP